MEGNSMEQTPSMERKEPLISLEQACSNVHYIPEYRRMITDMPVSEGFVVEGVWMPGERYAARYSKNGIPNHFRKDNRNLFVDGSPIDYACGTYFIECDSLDSLREAAEKMGLKPFVPNFDYEAALPGFPGLAAIGGGFAGCAAAAYFACSNNMTELQTILAGIAGFAVGLAPGLVWARKAMKLSHDTETRKYETEKASWEQRKRAYDSFKQQFFATHRSTASSEPFDYNVIKEALRA